MRWLTYLLLASIAVAAPSGVALNADDQKLASATLVGRLVNEHDEPVAGAVALLATGLHLTASAGSDGRFRLSIAPSPGGSIRGAVDDPNETVNKSGLWAIAFDRGFVRCMTPVRADGSFEFANLPVGDYGVKLGRLGFKDRDVEYGRPPADSPAWTMPTDPWLRATKCRVVADQTAQVKVRWSKN